MKIIVSPDSYKGCCSAAQAAQFMEDGILRVFPDAQVVKIPIADGGEGTVDALLFAVGGQRERQQVTGPLGSPVAADYAVLPDGVCVIEMAAASGLPLVPKEKLNPLTATSRGTGELIKTGLDRGCRKFILGIGGSATNDAGLGMAQVLGFSFLDAQGRELGSGGRELARLDRVAADTADPRLRESSFTVACDVRNLLCGPDGASAVYGPQKGATPEMVAELDLCLQNFARVVKRDLGKDVSVLPGGGAAGGLGAALEAFCGASIQSGIDTILDAVHFEERFEDCSLVITGEGSIDGQSAFGKVPVGVALRTKAYGPIPVFAVVGGMKPGAERVYDFGIDAIIPTATGPMTLDEAILRAPELFSSAAERLMRVLRAGITYK